MDYDVIVIGGGIIGTAVLDRLARYDMKALLLEKDDDVASFSTKANSGIVHAGYDCEPGTLKAKFNVLGNPLVYEDAERLGVPYLKCGSIVVATKVEELDELKFKAEKNGVEVRVLDREETRKIEPNASDSVGCSLFAPTAGIVSPYQLAIGYADRAILNGATVKVNSEVTSVKKIEDGFEVEYGGGRATAKCVVNCAGAYGAKVNDMAGAEHFETTYRRGDYFVLDSTERKNVHTVIFPLPTASGKGILIAPTADGNVIYGPTAIDTTLIDTASTLDGLDELKRKVPLSYKTPAFNKCIRVYSGLRTIIGHDFIVGESSKASGFFMAIGICSPGLTSAPAIAEELSKKIACRLNSAKKVDPVLDLSEKKRLQRMKKENIGELAKSDSRWGRIVCRCEKITEAEIVMAIHSPLPAVTVDAVKRRTRAGMGRCQGGFCGPRVMEIISRELNIPIDEVCKSQGANIARFKVKEVPDEI